MTKWEEVQKRMAHVNQAVESVRVMTKVPRGVLMSKVVIRAGGDLAVAFGAEVLRQIREQAQDRRDFDTYLCAVADYLRDNGMHTTSDSVLKLRFEESPRGDS